MIKDIQQAHHRTYDWEQESKKPLGSFRWFFESLILKKGSKLLLLCETPITPSSLYPKYRLLSSNPSCQKAMKKPVYQKHIKPNLTAQLTEKSSIQQPAPSLGQGPCRSPLVRLKIRSPFLLSSSCMLMLFQYHTFRLHSQWLRSQPTLGLRKRLCWRIPFLGKCIYPTNTS